MNIKVEGYYIEKIRIFCFVKNHDVSYVEVFTRDPCRLCSTRKVKVSSVVLPGKVNVVSGEHNHSKRRSIPLSLDIFLTEVKQSSMTLQEGNSDVLDFYYLFDTSKNISSDQCRRIGKRVEVIGLRVQIFCSLLVDTTQLPLPVLPYRYPLLAILQHMDQQIQQILSLLVSFRSLCKTASKKRDKMYREIKRKLELLVKDFQEMARYVQELSDRVRFEERKTA